MKSATNFLLTKEMNVNPSEIVHIEILEAKTAPAPQWSTVIPD